MKQISIFLTLAVVVSLVFCGAVLALDTKVVADEQNQDDIAVGDSMVGQKAVDFTLVHINFHTRQTFSMNFYEETKGKVTVLGFWWPGAKDCSLQVKVFNELSKEYKNKIKIIGIPAVSFYRPAQASMINRFGPFDFENWLLIQSHPEYSSLIPLLKKHKVGNYPFLIVFDDQGIVRFSEHNAPVKTLEQMKKIINPLLK